MNADKNSRFYLRLFLGSNRQTDKDTEQSACGHVDEMMLPGEQCRQPDKSGAEDDDRPPTWMIAQEGNRQEACEADMQTWRCVGRWFVDGHQRTVVVERPSFV